MGVIALIHLGITSSDLSMLMFAGITVMMLGVVKLAGMFKTSDWLCTSALFVFLLPFGIHVAVLSLLFGFMISVGNHIFVCIASNLSRSDPFPEIVATKREKFFAALSCKRRGPLDRFAYPAVLVTDGVMTFDYKSGMKKKKMDVKRTCPFIIPSIPILSFMCTASLIAIFLFQGSVF